MHCMQVDATDTLAKIALSFDTTPSELTRINKLASRMLFPGQVSNYSCDS